MAYIGNSPDAIQNSIEITRFNGDAACTQFQIPQDVDDAKAIEVLVNSVQQDPDNSYSVTNGLITFSEAPSVGTNNVTVLRRTGLTFTRTQIDVGDILPNAVTTIAIADGSITAAKIANGTIVTAEIADGAVTGPKLGANSVSSNNIISSLALTGNVSVTGNVTVGAGTVANPAISVVGDTNTGIFFPAADTIAFTEGGAESMRIDSSGNVGIGNTSPAEKLSVIVDSNSALTSCSLRNLNAGVSAAGRLVVGNDISNSAGLIFGSSTNSTFGANTLVLYQNNAAPVTIWTNNTERMCIDSSGRVTMPYQPFFYARKSTTPQTVANGVTATFDVTVTNIGSHYSTSTNRFTAPVSGVYSFTAKVWISKNGGAYASFDPRINGTLIPASAGAYYDSAISTTGNANYIVNFQHFLTAGDYVEFTFGTPGTVIVDNSGYFCGYLIG